MTDNNLYVTMLGTGHATVTKCYNTCFVLRENDQCFLVDAGGGNQILRILEEQGIGLTQIHDMFITHAHSDHILGAVWVIRMTRRSACIPSVKNSNLTKNTIAR